MLLKNQGLHKWRASIGESWSVITRRSWQHTNRFFWRSNQIFVAEAWGVPHGIMLVLASIDFRVALSSLPSHWLTLFCFCDFLGFFFVFFFFGNKDLSIVFHANSSMREGSPPKPGVVVSLHYLLSYSILKVRHNITTSCSASPWPCGFYSHSCFQPSQQPPLEEIQWESLLGRRDEAA